MLRNNGERLNIILHMKDMFNYDDFVSLCNSNNILPLSLNEFASKIGLLKVGLSLYPNLDSKIAYMKIVDQINSESNVREPVTLKKDDSTQIQITSKCGGCGGGTVR